MSTVTGEFDSTFACPDPNDDIGLAPTPPIAESKYEGTDA